MSNLPENLRLLLNNLDLLAGVKDNQKISFKSRTYYDKDGLMNISHWLGVFERTLSGERMEVNGIAEISSICKVSTELYEQYKDHRVYGKTLLDKIVEARKGLGRLKVTYESIGKGLVASSINVSGILLLDSIIPDSRKIEEGFCTASSLLKNEEITDENYSKQVRSKNSSDSSTKDEH